MTYQISYTNGRKSSEHDSLESAKAEILATWEDAYFYANDDRVLAWANEQDSDDDDGAKAVASIWLPERA
jgi:hypothetical protein